MVFSRILKTLVTILMVGIIVSGLLFAGTLVAGELDDILEQPENLTIKQFLRVYDLADDGDKYMIELIIGSIGDGLVVGNVLLRRKKQPLLFCKPEKLVLTYSQSLSIFRRATKDDPTLLDWSAGSRSLVVLLSLMKAFPCK